jgi:hypothetical protein
MTNTLDTPPAHYDTNIGDVMSNFDHEIEPDAEERLKSGPYVADYPGWDFHGTVWFGEGRFRCLVMRYRMHVDTLVADSLEEIMILASKKYGYE